MSKKVFVLFSLGDERHSKSTCHDPTIVDDLDVCLDHLSFISMLLRQLEHAGYK